MQQSRVRDRLELALAKIAAPQGEGSRCFIKLYRQGARDAADAADARARNSVSLGPLDGVLVSLKDLLGVAGEPTMAASPSYRDAPPQSGDAVVVRRLRQGGAIIVGKTNMTELAFSGVGINHHFGTPGNAADRLRVRFVVGCGGRLCGWHVRHFHRVGYRRVGAYPGGLQRHRRIENHLRMD